VGGTEDASKLSELLQGVGDDLNEQWDVTAEEVGASRVRWSEVERNNYEINSNFHSDIWLLFKRLPKQQRKTKGNVIVYVRKNLNPSEFSQNAFAEIPTEHHGTDRSLNCCLRATNDLYPPTSRRTWLEGKVRPKGRIIYESNSRNDWIIGINHGICQ
jgi:hypothetical protein